MKLPNASELKPYPKMKDSGIEWLGEVPAHWDLRRTKSLLVQRSEKGFPNEPLLAATQTKGVVRKEKYENRTVLAMKDLELLKIVRVGDFVISLRSFQGGIEFAREQGIISPAYTILYPFELDHHAYLAKIFKSRPYIENLSLFVTGIRQGQNIDYERLARSYLPLPPLSEQTAIVRFLDHADRRIRRYIRAKQKLVALLEEQRKTATQEAIQSRSVSIHRLEVVADLIERPIDRVTTNRYTPIGLYNRGRGIFKKEPRSGGELGDSDFFWIEEGDLVLSGQFAWEGAIALAGDTESGCVASHRYPILRGRQDVLDSGFLLAFFQTDWGQLLLDHYSRGAAGRNRPLNARTLLKEKIPLPPHHNQLDIVEMLQRETLVRQQAENLSRLLNEYRTRLIADVVTGKLDVRKVAAALPEVDPLGAESTLGDTFDTDTELDSAELDATLEEANA